jgi:hypothetical protein
VGGSGSRATDIRCQARARQRWYDKITHMGVVVDSSAANHRLLSNKAIG